MTDKLNCCVLLDGQPERDDILLATLTVQKKLASSSAVKFNLIFILVFYIIILEADVILSGLEQWFPSCIYKEIAYHTHLHDNDSDRDINDIPKYVFYFELLGTNC